MAVMVNVEIKMGLPLLHSLLVQTYLSNEFNLLIHIVATPIVIRTERYVVIPLYNMKNAW